MLSRFLIALALCSVLPTAVQAQSRNDRFDGCSVWHLPCQSPVVVGGSTDGCISVYSPGLKSMYVTAIFVTKSTFGIESYSQQSFYRGPLKNAVLVSKDKPLCLCRSYSGFRDENICDPKKMGSRKYGVAIRIRPIEDVHGNRNFDETLGVSEFRIDASGRVINLP